MDTCDGSRACVFNFPEVISTDSYLRPHKVAAVAVAVAVPVASLRRCPWPRRYRGRRLSRGRPLRRHRGCTVAVAMCAWAANLTTLS